MELQAFQKWFPEIGAKQRRVLILPEGGEEIPPGSYSVAEYYCADKTCDCRRVMLIIMDEQTREQVASISFGFDRDGPLRGPFLDPMNPQSAYAQEFLELANQVLLTDEDYVGRLERHYRMFKLASRGEIVPGPGVLSRDAVDERIATRKATRKLWRQIQTRKKKRKTARS